MAVASSAYFTLALDNNGIVWACGNNAQSQLGIAPEDENNRPQPPLDNMVKHFTAIKGLEDICAISCGRHHSVCADKQGYVWIFGGNGRNQLGGYCHGLQQHIPKKLPELEGITSVHCGTSFTVCISSAFEVFAFGDNSYGQLGFGNKESVSVVKQVPTLSNIHYAACGGDHVLFLGLGGEIFVSGNNSRGQLGLGNTTDQLVPIQIESLDECVGVGCGTYFSIVLSSTGSVYSFGDNVSGQLGIGKQQKFITVPTKVPVELEYAVHAIACGSYHSVFVETSGRMWVCGENTSGQLGLDNLVNRFEFERAPINEEVWMIACGGNHTFAKTTDAVYVFGSNNYHQLGLSTTVNDTKRLSDEYIHVIGEYSTTRAVRAKSARKIV